MNGIRRAILFASADRYGSLALNFLTIIAVSRLLTPKDIGVFAVGTSTIALVETLRDYVSGYLVQKRDLTEEDARTTFTCILLLSLLLVAVLLCLAQPIARLAHDRELVPFLRVVAFALLTGPFERPIMALLRRNMAFHTIAVINLTGISVWAATLVTLAALGFGPMSFAWAVLVGNAALVVMALRQPLDWKIFHLRLAGWRDVFTFSGYSSGAGVLAQLYELLPVLVIARILSIEAVGLFSRATLICQLPAKATLAAVIPVVLPVFATLTRESRDAVGPFLRMIELVSAVQWPALVLLALLAHPIVAALLGSQWSSIVPFVQCIAIASLLMFITSLCHPVLVAVGGVRHTLLAGLVSLPPSALIISMAAFFGLKTMVLSFFIVNQLQVAVALWVLRLYVPFGWSELAQACAKSALVTLSSAVGALLVIALGSGHLEISIPLGLAAGTCWCHRLGRGSLAHRSPAAPRARACRAQDRQQPGHDTHFGFADKAHLPTAGGAHG